MNIYALSSGRGPSGIAILRLSCKDTLKLCKKITKLENIQAAQNLNLLTIYLTDPNKIEYEINKFLI